jgi:serine protease Do
VTEPVWCSRCGTAIAADDRFCFRCGHPNVIPTEPGNAWQFEDTRTVPVPPVWPQGPTPPVEVQPPRRRGAGRALIAVLAVAGVLVTMAALGIGWRLIGHGSRHPATAPTSAAVRAQPPSTATVRSTSPPPPSARSTAAGDFAAIYARASSGVVRIETVGCSEQGVGTGFLLSPTLVATVNHVVADSAVVSLIDGDQRTTGTVIGNDPGTDLALVRANRPLAGFHFQLASRPPDVGSRVAAIGFPIGDPITLTVGDISGLNRNITINGNSITGLIETDTPINPGNSGGPLLTTDGTVTGLIDAARLNAAGIGYAIPATSAAARFRQWQANPVAQPPVSCADPLGPQQQANPNLPGTVGGLTDAQANGIVAALSTYFGGINSGNYAAAYAVLSPRLQARTPFSQFQTGDSTSFDSGFTVLGAQATSSTTALLALAFNSLQASVNGPNGDTCDDWTLDYAMLQRGDGSWLIDATTPHDGSSHTAC